MENLHSEKREWSIVLVGKFNPEMFSIDWFLKNEIIREEDAYFAKSIANKGSIIVSNAITIFKTENYSVTIDNNKFSIVGDKDPYITILDFVCKTFQRLSSYEISAYGFNYNAHYRVSDASSYQKIGDVLAPKKYWIDLLGEETAGDDRKSGLNDIRMIKVEKNENEQITMGLQPSLFLKPYGLFLYSNDNNIINNKEDCEAEIVIKNLQEYYIKKIEHLKELQERFLELVLKK